MTNIVPVSRLRQLLPWVQWHPPLVQLSCCTYRISTAVIEVPWDMATSQLFRHMQRHVGQALVAQRLGRATLELVSSPETSADSVKTLARLAFRAAMVLTRDMPVVGRLGCHEPNLKPE